MSTKHGSSSADGGKRHGRIILIEQSVNHPVLWMAETTCFQISFKLHKPCAPVPSRISFDDLMRPTSHNDLSTPRTNVRADRVGFLQNLKISRVKATLSHQQVRIVNLVLAENFKRRTQVLPQQFDFGPCQHSRSFRGNELPTG